jgi:DnaJ-class molecular chaperone
MSNYYEILGLNENAGEDEIKRTYRKLSLQHHPDRNSGKDTSGMFQKINEANEVLSDKQKRAEYDMKLKGGGNLFGDMGAEFGDLNHIFNAFFTGMPTNGMPTNGMPNVRVFNTPGGFRTPFTQQLNKPPPIMRHIDLTLEQAFTGGSFPIEIKKWILINGVENEEAQTIYITVPPGIDENEMVLLRGQGHQLSETVKGDIKINIKINNDTCFTRRGLDLIYKKEISLKESLCGFSFDLMHINRKTFTFNNESKPTIIKPGQTKVIPNLGMIRDNHTGNLIVSFEINFPNTITEEQRVKLKEIL